MSEAALDAPRLSAHTEADAGDSRVSEGAGSGADLEAQRRVEAQAAADLNAWAEELEAALRANPDALLEHFVRTATAIEVKKVAGGVWAEADNDQVSALREVVHLRLAIGNLSLPVTGVCE